MSLGGFFSRQSTTGRSLLFRILSEGFLSLKHFPLQNSSNSSSFPVIPPGSLHTLVSLKKVFSPPTPSLIVSLSASLFEEKAQKIYYFGKIFGRFLSSEELFTIHNLRILSECIFFQGISSSSEFIHQFFLFLDYLQEVFSLWYVLKGYSLIGIFPGGIFSHSLSLFAETHQKIYYL